MKLYWLIIFILVGVNASGEEKEKVETESVEELATIVLDKSVDYNPVGKRDPFVSFVPELKKAQSISLENPLQRYELSQLRLIGIVSNIPVPRAMFEDPSGKGWIVKVGANIGKHFGKVKSILPDTVVVVEEYHDRFGKLTINEVKINIEEQVKQKEKKETAKK